MKGQLAVTTPKEYLAQLPDDRRAEVAALDKLIRKTVPKLKPFIYSGMLSYGPIHYRYASGREGDAAKLSISSNATVISLYALANDAEGWVAERYKDALPKAKIGKSCIRFKRFDDLEPKALTKLLKQVEKTGYGG